MYIYDEATTHEHEPKDAEFNSYIWQNHINPQNHISTKCSEKKLLHTNTPNDVDRNRDIETKNDNVEEMMNKIHRGLAQRKWLRNQFYSFDFEAVQSRFFLAIFCFPFSFVLMFWRFYRFRFSITNIEEKNTHTHNLMVSCREKDDGASYPKLAIGIFIYFS